MKSLPAYYVLIVAERAHPVPSDGEPFDRPTFSQRLRALAAGVRPGRALVIRRPRPA